jgi:hypothetical protein
MESTRSGKPSGKGTLVVDGVSRAPAVMLLSAASRRPPGPMLTLVGTLAANHLKYS